MPDRNGDDVGVASGYGDWRGPDHKGWRVLVATCVQQTGGKPAAENYLVRWVQQLWEGGGDWVGKLWVCMGGGYEGEVVNGLEWQMACQTLQWWHRHYDMEVYELEKGVH